MQVRAHDGHRAEGAGQLGDHRVAAGGGAVRAGEGSDALCGDRPAAEHRVGDAEPVEALRLVRGGVMSEPVTEQGSLLRAALGHPGLLQADHVGVELGQGGLDRPLARLPRPEAPPQVPRDDPHGRSVSPGRARGA